KAHVKRKFYKTVKDDVSEQSEYYKGLLKDSEDSKGDDKEKMPAQESDSKEEEAGFSLFTGKSVSAKIVDKKTDKSAGKAAGKAPSAEKRKPRTNPYQKILDAREKEMARKQEEREQREKEIKQATKRRNKYEHDRKVLRKKHNARTSKGQPVLANQITDLLGKIRKMNHKKN
ncbi:hypothetical protein EC988_006872, partial [Linderina pennispora]